MAETGAVDDHAVVLGRKIDKTTGFKILDHTSVAVEQQEHHLAALNVMEPNSVYVEYFASGGLSRSAFLASCVFMTAAATRAAVAIADVSTNDDVLPRCPAGRALRSRLAGLIAGMSVLGPCINEIAGHPGNVALQYEPVGPSNVPLRLRPSSNIRNLLSPHEPSKEAK